MYKNMGFTFPWNREKKQKKEKIAQLQTELKTKNDDLKKLKQDIESIENNITDSKILLKNDSQYKRKIELFQNVEKGIPILEKQIEQIKLSKEQVEAAQNPEEILTILKSNSVAQIIIKNEKLGNGSFFLKTVIDGHIDGQTNESKQQLVLNKDITDIDKIREDAILIFESCIKHIEEKMILDEHPSVPYLKKLNERIEICEGEITKIENELKELQSINGGRTPIKKRTIKKRRKPRTKRRKLLKKRKSKRRKSSKRTKMKGYKKY